MCRIHNRLTANYYPPRKSWNANSKLESGMKQDNSHPKKLNADSSSIRRWHTSRWRSYAPNIHTHERTRSIRWHWRVHLRRAFARRIHHHTVRWEQRILSTSATQKLPTRTYSWWHQHIRHIIQIRWVRPHHSWLPMPRPQLGGQTGRTSRGHTQ